MIKNELDKFINYTVKYVMAAFSHSEDACFTDIDGGIGEPGASFSGKACGKPAVVILNDFKTKKFTIEDYETEFNYYGSQSPTTTQMIGSIKILDRYGGYFPTFLKEAIDQLKDVSHTHAAFSLRVFFVGTLKDGSVEIVPSKPLIFNMVTVLQSIADFTANYYTMYFVAAYNTTAQFPGFSKLYQTTITHSEKNPKNEIPKPDIPLNTILPRGIEDDLKKKPREKRLEKNKTMRTLKDVFEGMAADLMEQKYVHKRQLQEWLNFVRDDYEKKIDPPIQRKPPGELPVDYRLLLDSAYSGYEIDNRNMPFEQPEQSQTIKGIRSINLPEGETLPVMFDRLLKLSTQVAKDFVNGLTYKTVFILLRRCEGKYDVFMKLKQIIRPQNSQSLDTGPGKGPMPLEFEFQRPGTGDIDATTLMGKVNSNIKLDMLEKQIDNPDAKIVFGNREQSTAERNADLLFFKTFFSGVRMNVNNKNNSLEFGDHGGTFDNSLSPNIAAQSNIFNIAMRGNPDLLSDVNRNPFKVYNDDDDSPVFYKFPEYEPMYSKIITNLTPIDRPDYPDIPELYYYTNYYHVYKIKTMITGDDFKQELGLLRKDDYS